MLVLFSTASTFNIPFASRSYVISIWGCPLGIGGIPCKSNVPNLLLSLTNDRSPSKILTVTAGWLSAYVENVWVFFVGIVVLRLINVVITSPAVSIPRDKGATSNRSKSSVRSDLSPLRIDAWTAAPYATASSGLIDLFNCFPLKKSDSRLCTLGILVDPPTKTISCTCPLDILASLRTFSTGAIHLRNKYSHSFSNFALLKVNAKSIPSCKLSTSIFAVVLADKVLFARSHAVFNLLTALILFFSLMPLFFLSNSLMHKCNNTLSKSSPPRCVSPAVAFTSKIPSSIVSRDTSNVPPPKSKIKIFCSPFFFLSNPYAIAAAVGSLIIRNTSRPAIAPASFVACLWASLK